MRESVGRSMCCDVRIRAADCRSQPRPVYVAAHGVLQKHPAIRQPRCRAREKLPAIGLRGGQRPPGRRPRAFRLSRCRFQGRRSAAVLTSAFGTRIKSPHRAQDLIGNFPLASSARKRWPQGRKDLLEAVVLEIADVTGPIVILAIARNRLVAIDGEVVIGFSRQRPASEALPAQPRRPFQIEFPSFANHVADDPVKSPALHAR